MEEVRWCTRPLLEDHTLVERWGARRLLRDHKWFGLSEGREGEELKEKRAWNPGLKQMELFLVSGEESWTDQKNNCLKIFICKNSHVVKPALLLNSSMNSDKCIKFCISPHGQTWNSSITPHQSPPDCCFGVNSPPSQATTGLLFSVPISLPFQKHHINRIR